MDRHTPIALVLKKAADHNGFTTLLNHHRYYLLAFRIRHIHINMPAPSCMHPTGKIDAAPLLQLLQPGRIVLASVDCTSLVLLGKSRSAPGKQYGRDVLQTAAKQEKPNASPLFFCTWALDPAFGLHALHPYAGHLEAFN